MSRTLRGLAVCVLPVLAGLWVAATEFGGTLLPWRPVMVDLEVYRAAARVLMDGGDIYALPGQLQFLYPPLAAVLAVPLAVAPDAAVQIGWTVAGVLALLAVLHRVGLRGWVLSLVATGCVVFVEPVRQTLGFGQLGIFLVALVVLDLVPGPRVLARRLLPEGVWTAVATCIKLTPALFAVYLLLVRRRRAFVVAVVTGVVLTALAWVVVPGPSALFWGRLAHGDTGLGHSLIYFTNQSALADAVRVVGLGRTGTLVGLGLSAVVAALGVWAAVLWHQRGDVPLAVMLGGVATLLASPVSWLHHFVWVVPLAVVLVRDLLSRGMPSEPVEGLGTPLELVEGPRQGSACTPPELVEGPRQRSASTPPELVEGPRQRSAPTPPELVEGPRQRSAPTPPELVEGPRQRSASRPPRRLPVWFGVLGLLFCGWVAVEPFRNLPGGGDLELTWTPAQNALASVTLVLGVLLLVSAIAVGRRRTPGVGADADRVAQSPTTERSPALREARP